VVSYIYRYRPKLGFSALSFRYLFALKIGYIVDIIVFI